MPQQINLFSPILLAPRRHFSARTMAEALAVLVLGIGAIAGWSVHTTARLKQDLAAAQLAGEPETQRLAAQIAARAAPPQDTRALEQQMATLRLTLAERRALLTELVPAVPAPERGNAAWLALLAQTVPASVWLAEARRADGRIELAGTTVQPEALRPWLAALAAHPAAAGRTLRTVRVERADGDGADAWNFRVVSGSLEGAR
jgi:hypothetical protein